MNAATQIGDTTTPQEACNNTPTREQSDEPDDNRAIATSGIDPDSNAFFSPICRLASPADAGRQWNQRFFQHGGDPMNTKRILFSFPAAILLVALTVGPAWAQEFPVLLPDDEAASETSITAATTDAFSYQGYIQDAGQPANGNYDFYVTVWNQESSGSIVGTCPTVLNVPVTNGVFDLQLQPTEGLNQVFNGEPRWIRVDVRKSGTSTYTSLPRSPITASPYAWSLRPGARMVASYAGSMLRIENLSTSSAGGLYVSSKTPTGISIRGHHEGDGYGVYGSTNGGYPAVGGINGGAGVGVYGSSSSGTAVHGTSTNGIGVVGVRSGYTTADITSSNPGGFFGGPIGVVALSKYTNGYGLLGENLATSGTFTTGVVGRTSSPTGYGGHFSGGIALYARAVNNSTPDLVLAGNSATDDNGLLSSDPAYPSSDLAIISYDDVNIQLDRNGDEAGVFWISNDAGTNVFSVDEAGTVRVNGAAVHTSDRNMKEAFEPIDPEAVLRGVVNMPILKWRFIDQAETHLGPVAQDFRAAFGLGENDLGIASVDADGVALASIQALYRLVEQLQADNAALKARIERIEATGQ